VNDKVLLPIFQSLPAFEHHEAVSELGEVGVIHLPSLKVGCKPGAFLLGPEGADLPKVLPLRLESRVQAFEAFVVSVDVLNEHQFSSSSAPVRSTLASRYTLTALRKAPPSS